MTVNVQECVNIHKHNAVVILLLLWLLLSREMVCILLFCSIEFILRQSMVCIRKYAVQQVNNEPQLERNPSRKALRSTEYFLCSHASREKGASLKTRACKRATRKMARFTSQRCPSRNSIRESRLSLVLQGGRFFILPVLFVYQVQYQAPYKVLV